MWIRSDAPTMLYWIVIMICLWVPVCPAVHHDCYWTPDGKDYSGTRNVTRSGRTCQRWDVQTPHEHTRTDSAHFPDATLADTENYCRNPDGEPSPWCYTTDADKRWELCDTVRCQDVGEQECKMETGGSTYRGLQNRTTTGKLCQSWDTVPHGLPDSSFASGSAEAELNYCRNPEPSTKTLGPWCYTLPDATAWEYCDIVQCDLACKRSFNGEDYQGNISTTISGKTCQRWEMQTPHAHSQSASNFPDSTLTEAENYCRNPGGNQRDVWCYTTDPYTTIEFCQVPVCAPHWDRVEYPEITTIIPETTYLEAETTTIEAETTTIEAETTKIEAETTTPEPTTPIPDTTAKAWTTSATTEAGTTMDTEMPSAITSSIVPSTLIPGTTAISDINENGTSAGITLDTAEQITTDGPTTVPPLNVSSPGVSPVMAWSVWTLWSACSQPCNAGTRRRFMLCSPGLSNRHLVTNRNITYGYKFEVVLCNTSPCPVAGRWTSWSPWSPCSVTCGSGTSLRARRCFGPFHGGRRCKGPSAEYTFCEGEDECPMTGNRRSKKLQEILEPSYTEADKRPSSIATGTIAAIFVVILGVCILLIDVITLVGQYRDRWKKIYADVRTTISEGIR